jgi:hypothetical protein
MDIISIPSTSKTPAIKFDAQKGLIEIKGRSIPENSAEFYKPLIESLNKYSPSPGLTVQADIFLEFFNTISSKCVLDILRRLETIHIKGNKVVIKWYFEQDDKDMQEAGVDFQAIVNLSFIMVPIEAEGDSN